MDLELLKNLTISETKESEQKPRDKIGRNIETRTCMQAGANTANENASNEKINQPELI